MRAAIAAQNGQPQRNVVVYAGDLQSILNERIALRFALAEMLHWTESIPGEELRADALREVVALGEDE